MHTRNLITALASLTVVLGAAVPEKRNTCQIDLQGVNSEGGGGPGQAPTNDNAWSVHVSGGTVDFFKRLSTDDGGFGFAIEMADYGGDKNMFIEASWNYGGNAWSFCQVSYDGGPYITTQEQSHIDSGTVSESYSDCYWTFDC